METYKDIPILTAGSDKHSFVSDSFIALIDKEPGCTSFDVVAKLRKITGIKKIGHTGTLDPFATGLLVMLIGKATKLQEILTATDKEYEAELKLGERTDSLDCTGTVTDTSGLKVSSEDIIAAVKDFEGHSQQYPPMYSAIKINGKRLYKLARKGIEIKREPREIFISSIKVLSADYPFVNISVRCSKGTYIRSLADDIGQKLGTFAHLSGLRRTSSGDFKISDAMTVSEFSEKWHSN